MVPCLQGRRGQQLIAPFSPYLISLLRYHCGFNMVGARTGIRSIGWPFSKNFKEFIKTGTVKAATVCELRPTKVHYKDTCDDNLSDQNKMFNIGKFRDFFKYTADLITGLHAEPLTESGLKNIVYNVKPVTMSIKIMSQQSQRPFVVSAQRVEIWPFPTSATLTGIYARAMTCFENPCYQNINSSRALTFDGLDIQNQNTSVELRAAPKYQGATDSYYIANSSQKRSSPPIFCPVHDTFWLFSPAAGGSCIYDTSHSFDEVNGPICS
ncbi:MAG: hypothetical protein EZS28_003986 [Streblomastix strix]|uniref:Uncharacterized protein n=1 Tax=Streblomastix strix TaxID=222440 RepID=A0A5J4WZX1_9EUKA|nr:MAG: hypothetical protein EZS28_003986 [Streblomastix strix]